LSGLAQRIRTLDRAVFGAIFGLKWPPLTSLMRALTVAGTAGATWGFIAAGAFLLTGLELWRLLVPWSAIVISWLVAEGTKHLFNRARPYVSDTAIAPLIKTPSSSSFPSGGCLTALSRVYLGVHYPVDVLAGFCIGILAALGALAVSGVLA
jgi:undecaprenyl-diphosphatase